MTLRDLQMGESAVITTVGGRGALRQHFLDMGMIPGVQVTLVKYAPMGDPMELRLHGYELTLRLADAEQIEIEEVQKAGAEHEASKAGKGGRLKESGRFTDHPGLGEGGKYHEKETEHPLPDGTTLTFALAGNQNCGKTTLFNQLTGSNQHVGNFPGVTVDRKSGVIRGHENTLVTDLPGIYSLSPYTSEEIVSRQFILDEKPTGIINIVDATNIERNLYLTMQLMELDVPMAEPLISMRWRHFLEFRLYRFRQRRMKVLRNLQVMRCMWRSTRNAAEGKISAMRVIMAVRFTAVYMALCI